MHRVYLGLEMLDSEFGRDTIDRDLRRRLLSEGYSIETSTDYYFRVVRFYAVKPLD